MLNVPYNSAERPPFVRFEEREYGLDNVASEKAGRPIPKLVHFAIITSFGSKDEHEKVAEEWIASIRAKAVRGEYNPEWASKYAAQYSEYLKGNELPREGTPVQTCPLFTREQVRRLKSLGLTTVEDLASQPDSMLGTIGLDGRAMRDMAKTWISEALDKGVAARELAKANTTIETLQVQMATMARLIEELLSKGKTRAA